MSKFTIEHLEALKEGITPGAWEATKNHILKAGWKSRLLEEYPWYAEDEWEEEITYMAPDDEFVLSNPEPDYRPLTDNQADMELAASAPALLDQLIATEAELQHLKGKIEGLADWHDVKASKARVYPRPQEKERFIGKAEAHETARNKLAQILEGHNE